MADIIVDPDRFLLAAAFVDWRAHARRDENAIARLRSWVRPKRIVQLRWVTHESLGYPTQPFEVWRRPALSSVLEVQLPVDQPNHILQSIFGWTAYEAPSALVFVRANVKVTGAQASVAAFAGAPFGSALLGTETLTNGFHKVSFSGAHVGCLVLIGDVELLSWAGVAPDAATQGNWELIERVGLPVDPQEWQGVHQLDGPQGPPATPMLPFDAAMDRFARGAAPFGWASVMAPGRAAPPWQQADPKAFLQMMAEDVLGGLKEMVSTLQPDQHVTLVRNVTLAAEAGGEDATASFSLLRTMLLGAATDPVTSLLAGFGTSVEEVDLPPISIRDVELLNDPSRSDYDFKVTATYAKGLDGRSDPVTYAALALAPKLAVPPPPPANLSSILEGLRSPPVPDADWRPVVRLSWDRLPPILPLRSASYAHARADGAATTAGALLVKRKHDVALHPIGLMSTSDNPVAALRLNASDDSFQIPGSPPVVPLLYGVAHQDIFGLWSPWRTTGISVAEPSVDKIAILSASLAPTPVTGPCPGTLHIEFTWDWSRRTPASIDFVGRLYGQAKRGDPPTPAATPAGLQQSLGGPAGAPFQIRFLADGSVDADASGTIEHMSTDGAEVLAGPSGAPGTRRYRLHIEGFSLDFDASRHIGLLLQGRATEKRPPMRTGTFSLPETIVSASDPRPPVIAVEHEDVLLASFEDSAGRHHAVLSWPAASNAAGYFIYSAAEGKLRVDWGLGEGSSETTLSERLIQLRDGFAVNPDKRFFTRLNDKPMTATSYEAVLPRGTRDIHLFLVIGISAGGFESDWPNPADPLLRKRPIAYAAPLKRVPEPPTLEARRVPVEGVPDQWNALLRLATRPGVFVDRIDLHRVRVPEAALELDTMGPPVVTLRPGQAGWTIDPLPDDGVAPGQALGIVRGTDAPEGSWKPVYYRAAAWSVPDPTRGILGGRSKPSAARELIVPPSGPPDLAGLVASWPGGAPELVDIQTTTSAPVGRTLLGDHRVRVELFGHVEGEVPQPLYSWPPLADGMPGDARLETIAESELADTGLWRETTVTGTKLHLKVRRASTDILLSAIVRLEDPLGRFTEQVLEVPADPPLPVLDFGPVTLTAVPGKGFIVGSTINLPLSLAGVPYQVRAILAPRRQGRIFPPPPPVRPRLLFNLDLSDIPRLRRNEDPFQDPPPARRSKDGEGTALGIYIGPRGGRLQVTITGPNSETTSFVMEVL